MNIVALLFAAAVAVMPLYTHYVYRFGFNTKVADSGPNTGTTTIDVKGIAPDGGLVVDGTDFWWNTVRARQTSECEVYADGSVMCDKAPNQLSPMQLTIFPLLAKDYLRGLTSAGATKTNSFKVRAVFFPAANGGFVGTVHTWSATYTYTGKGPLSGSGPPTALITSTGMMKTTDGPYVEVKQQSNVGYDTSKNVPAVVNMVLTPVHMRSVYNNMVVDMRLTQLGTHP